MSSSVLYDSPGPKAHIRNRVYSVVGSVAVLALIAFAIYRLYQKGQLEPEVWNIFNNAGVRQLLLDGVLSTLKVFAVAGVLSLVFGLLLAVARASEHRWVSWLATGFIELFRAVPLLITIYGLWVVFLTYKGSLGAIGVNNSFWALVVGLSVYNSCVQAEVLRAGFNAVPRGQVEAAYAVGLRKSQVMTMLLVPQAVRSMLPTIISQLVVTLKDTSLGSIITYAELLFAARWVANNTIVNGENPITPVVIVVAAIYIAMCLALSSLATWIERRGRRAKTGIAVASAAEPNDAAGAIDGIGGPAPVGVPATAPETAAPESARGTGPQTAATTSQKPPAPREPQPNESLSQPSERADGADGATDGPDADGSGDSPPGQEN